MIIYKVTFPNSKIYIGQTCRSLHKRKIEHYADSYKRPQGPFHHALKKFKNLETWEVLDSGNSVVELNFKETYWIKFYQANTKSKGYNCNTGGDSKIASLETRKKQSQAQLNRIRSSEETKKLSDNTKKLNLLRKLKDGYGEDFKLKLSRAQGGRPFFVYKDSRCLGIFENQRTTALKLGLLKSAASKISLCLHKKRKFHKGYSFRYVEEVSSGN